jgi:hypothetical protein
MNGPAGVGKSAIAQTCAEKVKDSGQLGAAFFFSIHGRSDHTRFFTTIAYQLSTVLPEYKDILNRRVYNDKTVVRNVMASQFKTLIAEPLQELKAQGREVGRRVIFIDGLDECQNTDAQVEIIELIAASVRDCTTPLRWAFFSRAEAHIEATFSLCNVAPLCRRVFLPISREANGEIQLYLEGGFQNILRLRNLSFSPPWPSKDAIQKLVDASAGLYAYPATVLRFIDLYPSADLQEPLAAVLAAISSPNNSTISPFAELDAFYMLILRRVPDHILPSVKLLFTLLFEDYHSNDPLLFDVAPWFNQLGLTEAMFKSMRNHLHAVAQFQDTSESFHLGAGIDPARPYYEQTNPSPQTRIQIDEYLGLVSFHHKSFYDFLADPARSFTFCATGPEMRLKLFNHRLEFHLRYASTYAVKGSGTANSMNSHLLRM